MSLIDPGKKAPAFRLKDQDGREHALADYAGRPLVLYFYPKDDTPGCTAETCSFRDRELGSISEHSAHSRTSAGTVPVSLPRFSL